MQYSFSRPNRSKRQKRNVQECLLSYSYQVDNELKGKFILLLSNWQEKVVMMYDVRCYVLHRTSHISHRTSIKIYSISYRQNGVSYAESRQSYCRERVGSPHI